MPHCSPLSSARLRWASTLGVAVAALVAAWCNRLPGDETPYVQDERSYAVFDALFRQRNNATVNRPIVVSRTATSAPEIMAGDLQSTIGSGARFLYGNYGENDIGWEVGYLGVYGMSAAKTATSAGGSLEAPNQLFAAQTGLDKGFPPESPTMPRSIRSSSTWSSTTTKG